jgi:hypothetical protein
MIQQIKAPEKWLTSGVMNQVVTLIGCGAVGSTAASFLARMGFEKFILYDPDVVEEKNIANQTFDWAHIGKAKTAAVEEQLKRINPGIKVVKRNAWAPGARTEGIIIQASDSIEVRRQLFELLKTMAGWVCCIEYRMELYAGQAAFAWPYDLPSIDCLAILSDVTEEEVAVNAARSACGETLSVCPAGAATVSMGLSAFQQSIVAEIPTPHFMRVSFYNNVVTAIGACAQTDEA